MESGSNETPLIVILGVTGSGKSALSLELARAFNGEIIAADSRTVYKGMDISTAKPSNAEQIEITHHLIDVVSPDESFAVSDFKISALKAIEDSASRGKLPIVVGGTGLYIDALLYDFTLLPKADDGLRNWLSQKSVAELHRYISDKGLPMPKDSRNPRRLIRVIETGGHMPTRRDVRPNTLVIGLCIDRASLLKRITERVDLMVASGLVTELRSLSKLYGWDAPALQTPSFKAFRRFLGGEITLDEAKVLFVRNDMNLAKRQYTWFKRNKDVRWVNSKEEAVDLVTTFLNKY